MRKVGEMFTLSRGILHDVNGTIWCGVEGAKKLARYLKQAYLELTLE
jgi:hypothetical protein